MATEAAAAAAALGVEVRAATRTDPGRHVQAAAMVPVAPRGAAARHTVGHLGQLLPLPACTVEEANRRRGAAERLTAGRTPAASGPRVG